MHIFPADPAKCEPRGRAQFLKPSQALLDGCVAPTSLGNTPAFNGQHGQGTNQRRTGESQHCLSMLEATGTQHGAED